MPFVSGSKAVNGSGGRAASASRVEKQLLERLLASIGNPPLRIVLWDGQTIETGDGSGSRLVIRSRRALWRLLASPWLRFGEEYAAGNIEVEDGGLVTLLEEVHLADQQRQSDLNPVKSWLQTGRGNTLARAQRNIHHHYDIGNHFYRLWLDEDMVYTCAYFPESTVSLEEAQQAKMAHVCRKLRLQPGETVVEAGCGWGSLARFIARHYGVKVRAYNISSEQVAYARQRAKAEGLADRVEYVQDDYRNITGDYDVFVSVGMLEHVGKSNLSALGAVIDQVLKDTGRGLVHSIGQNRPTPLSPWLRKHIFPGAYPPTLREAAAIFEPHGFAIQDVENLRLHYAKTLEHWLNRFEDHADEVERMFDTWFVRTWRLYLSGSLAAFNAGVLQLFQVTFSRPTNNDLPWTRAYLYEAER